MICGVNNGPGGHLRLIDRRNWLRVMRQPDEDPGELRGADGGQLHHGGAHTVPVVQQLAPQGIVEPLDGMLGAAIAGLQGNSSVRQGRAHLDDGAAVSGPHVPPRGHGSVHETEIAHLGHAPELIGLNVSERREDGGESRVDPDVDRPELGLNPGGGGHHLFRIGDIRGDPQRASTPRQDIIGCRLKTAFPARRQSDRL